MNGIACCVDFLTTFLYQSWSTGFVDRKTLRVLTDEIATSEFPKAVLENRLIWTMSRNHLEGPV